tara:strand:+ start:398 stop:790 length:393 start_codon:yes stop_codon:yes gene_type:complete
MSGTRENKAHNSKKRPARIPMSAGNKLHIPEHLKEDGYFYYWAIDRKGAIEQMEAVWYERVKDDRGEDLTVPGGKGETHYAMKIKQEYYDEDIAKQQQRNIDATTKMAQKLNEDEYVPQGRQNVMEREII